MYIIGRDRQNVKRQYIVYKDTLEEINGYQCYKIAMRVLFENIPTDFVPLPQYNDSPSDAYDSEDEAWEMLTMWLKDNKIIFRKETDKCRM